MNAEQFHDAIGLLPSDLIAGADKKRCTKPKVIPWKRYAAMAACFAVVLSCGLFALRVFAPKGAMESAMEPAAQAPSAAAPKDIPTADAPAEAAPTQAPAADAEESGIDWSSGSGGDRNRPVCGLPVHEPDTWQIETPLKPTTACFSSSAIVTLIRSRSELESYLTEKDWIYDFTGFPESFDETWFTEHDLLLVAMLDISSDHKPEFDSLEREGEMWDLVISYYPVEIEGEPTSTAWHILVEVEKDQIPNNESVTLFY